MLLVVEPLALVHRAICVNEHTITVGFPVEPISLINVVISVSHSSLAIENSVFSHTLVSGAIWKYDDADAFPGILIFAPLSFVFSLSYSHIIRIWNRFEIVDPDQVFATPFIVQKSLQFFRRNHRLINIDQLLSPIVWVTGLFELY